MSGRECKEVEVSLRRLLGVHSRRPPACGVNWPDAGSCSSFCPLARTSLFGHSFKRTDMDEAHGG